MKRRHRKQVLDINGENVAVDSHRRRWPNNERQINNGSPSNPLANLVGQYNSDSEADDDHKPRARVLNEQVNDFLKEIQSIPQEEPKDSRNMSHPGSYWQECYDEQTGYPYYWHMETNQVTWEVPPELKALREKDQRSTPPVPHGSNIPQWSNAPPKNYQQSQSNIPEGMIPKEVVVRNRNRQAGIVSQPVKPPVKLESSKSPVNKDDPYDDGKIEMITSFGNDESESEESDHEKPVKEKVKLKKSSKFEKSSHSTHSLETKESRIQIGPAPPPVAPLNYGPVNIEKLSERLSQNIQREKSQLNSDNKYEDDMLQRLKNQAKLLQNCGNGDSNLSRDDRSHTPPKPPVPSNFTNKSKKNIKLSLVPGYEDDSEGEDESSSNRKTAKPLFPISEQLPSTDSSSDVVIKKFEGAVGNIRVYDYRNTDSTQSESKTENISEDGQTNPEEKSEEGLESKANKFLESIDAPSKAFQRKRRIAFDVAPTKSKEAEPKEELSTGTPIQISSTDASERRGFGFPKDDARNSPDVENTKTESDNVAASKKPGGIAFVKSTEENSNSNGSSSDKNASNVNKPREIGEVEKAEVKQLTEPIMEKLKFLSEGSPPASAVQIMAIQIQTLLGAWEVGALQETFLRNWLVGTSSELTRLEQTAAPSGWECQWDRSHKRYYYRNSTTGEAQWTYPAADIAGGTEEMDLCTTPPPPEHVETPIIEMSTQAATINSNSSSSSKDQKEVKPPQQPPPPPSDPVAPPPPPPPAPQISSPSPPPPPRICAEDLKRGKKRKGSPDKSEHDEDSKDGKLRGLEPLPPGVDSSEIAYTLSASALEAGVLYGAQQTNPIYAATLAGAAAAAGIPLLSHHPHHHHPALMQGQLVHYNSAYHQHLHNQALVAARLSGQEAVQFMVAAEYARVYENNQVIAKPPVKMAQDTSLGSAINSFYSDIASIENPAEQERERIEAIASPALQPVPQMEVDPAVAEAMKDKKKKKLKTGIGKKQKEMSSMVAKWQRAQSNYKD